MDFRKIAWRSSLVTSRWTSYGFFLYFCEPFFRFFWGGAGRRSQNAAFDTIILSLNTGTTAHRYTDTLVHRRTNAQVHPNIGILVHRDTGTPIHWYTGTLVYQDTGTRVQQHTGTPVHRYTGTPIPWYTGIPAHWYRYTGTQYTGTPKMAIVDGNS